MLVVSFYTKNTQYEKEVEGLINSCEKFGIESDIVGIDSLGAWDKNCCYKPQFIEEMLKKHNRPIVWIDADGIIVKPTKYFETLTCDLSVTFNKTLPITHPSRVISNTVYFAYNPIVVHFVEQWKEECKMQLKDGGEVWDQTCLRDTIYRFQDQVDVSPLPKAYATIYDQVEEGEECSIVHYQASRHYKKLINNEVLPLFGEHGLTARDFAQLQAEQEPKASGHQNDTSQEFP